MCIALAGCHSNTTVIATDRRHGLIDGGESVRYFDIGGRLLRRPNGWLVCVGDAVYGCVVLSALDDIPPGPLCHQATAALRQASLTAGTRVHAWPGWTLTTLVSRSSVLIASDGEVAHLAWDGRVVQAGGDGTLVGQYPIECPEYPSVFAAQAEQATSPFDLARAMAREVQRVNAISRSVSTSAEFAIGDRYFCGEAADLVGLSDAALDAALGSPPPIRELSGIGPTSQSGDAMTPPELLREVTVTTAAAAARVAQSVAELERAHAELSIPEQLELLELPFADRWQRLLKLVGSKVSDQTRARIEVLAGRAAG